MKISVVTAVRDGASHIGVTLESVKMQSHPSVEHVIVDGASTDGTLDVVRRLAADTAHVISELDRGVYDAFNKGVRAASGDVIAILSAGDTYQSRTVLAQVAAAFAAPSVDAVFGDLVIVDPLDSQRVLRRFRSGTFTPRRLARGFMPAHPALFLRRGVYERFGLYDESYRIAGDFEYCVRIFHDSRTAYSYLPEILVRMPAGGLSNRGWRSKLTITREMLRACRQNAVPTSLLKLLSRFPVKAFELTFRSPGG